MQGTTFLSFSSVSFEISFEHAVQLPFTVFLYSPFPDNYAFLSLSPSQIQNIQSADTVPVHGHSPLVEKPGSDCQHCDALTPEQLAQLSTPSYKLKKEKRDKADTTPSKNAPTTKVTLSPTLVDPARVSVIRAVDCQDTGLSAQLAEKKKKVEDKKKSKPSASVGRLQSPPTRGSAT